MTEIKYPIGEFSLDKIPDRSDSTKMIDSLLRLPIDLRETILDLNETQLNTPYRTGGWSVLQVVHHLPDSHLNGYLRFKWALSENKPQVKPYDQDAWAFTPENDTTPPLVSVSLLQNLHERWTYLLNAMSNADFDKTYINPESGEFTLFQSLALYEWHGRHHLAQITALKNQLNW